jgi:hypothetical protein
LVDDFAAGIQILWTNPNAPNRFWEKAVDFGESENKIGLYGRKVARFVRLSQSYPENVAARKQSIAKKPIAAKSKRPTIKGNDS